MELDYSSMTDRKIIATCESKLGFVVLITEPEFEIHAQYKRFSNADKSELLNIITNVLINPTEVYFDNLSDSTTVYSAYKTENHNLYLVGVKLDKIKNIGFFQTVMKLDSVRTKHLKLRKVL
jgi:hypothetical protein